MSKNALIGYTGFIGQNLSRQMNFDYFYNSKNISKIQNKEFDLVVSCGNPSTRWLVNKDPLADLSNILSFIENIKTIKTKKFILISTIDVYETPYSVNEDTQIEDVNKNKYGENRYFLEKKIKDIFSSYLIVRLPIIYGPFFKKNIIFDALNQNELHKVNENAIIQIYNVKNLSSDLTRFSNNNWKLVNLATEPILTKELYKEVFKIELNNNINAFFKYDVQTKYNDSQNYFYNKKEILTDLKEFKVWYEANRI